MQVSIILLVFIFLLTKLCAIDTHRSNPKLFQPMLLFIFKQSLAFLTYLNKAIVAQHFTRSAAQSSPKMLHLSAPIYRRKYYKISGHQCTLAMLLTLLCFQTWKTYCILQVRLMLQQPSCARMVNLIFELNRLNFWFMIGKMFCLHYKLY